MLTDNSVLVRKLVEMPALMCAQRKAEKRISEDTDFIKSNIDSFGNDIGQTTNWITSMFEVRDKFDADSQEYQQLTYRIQCGELYQQNAIDKAKGIICKPMPKSWHDKHAISKSDDDIDKDFYRRIVADKKPYFMRYIYPQLMKQYNTYIKCTEQNAYREFQMSVREIKNIPNDELTDKQGDFLHFYDKLMPVGVSNCVMNKICMAFEDEFDSRAGDNRIKPFGQSSDAFDKNESFDYTIMKSDSEYTIDRYYAIKKLHEEYNKKMQSYQIFAKYERIDKMEANAESSRMREDYLRKCYEVCSNSRELSNIILDICYSHSSTRKFAWDICGHEIISNLLENNNNVISYPTLDDNGEIEFCGNRYTIKTAVIGMEDKDECSIKRE